ncbi:MAG: NUDIX domain-containing protein [Woeseiaceae bacterium]|nr:NUDIX domain-containing protein [Woeseiaceae bacterium]
MVRAPRNLREASMTGPVELRYRPSSRLLILDPANRVLLLNFRFTTTSGHLKVFWATPGGGLEGDETFEQAAMRELIEETGIAAPIGPQVAQRDSIYELPDGETVRADERFFLVRTERTVVSNQSQSALEQRVIIAHRWWTASDISNSTELIYPQDLAGILGSL